MCHRFHIKTPTQAIADALAAVNRCTQTRFDLDLFPLGEVPVLRQSEGGDGDVPAERQLELVQCSWSLLPRWWRPSSKLPSGRAYVRKYPTFNARSETLHQKPSFRQSFADRRALVPCTGFFEHGHYFGLIDEPLFWMAGLWDRWTDGSETIESCTIVTTAANALVGKHHPRNRMPVILADPKLRKLWLDPEFSAAQHGDVLFRPLDEKHMKTWPADNDNATENADVH